MAVVQIELFLFDEILNGINPSRFAIRREVKRTNRRWSDCHELLPGKDYLNKVSMSR
jgi:hypothetical protein